MLKIEEMTTEELEQFVRNDVEMRDDEDDTDLLLAVLDELVKRRQAERPVEFAAGGIRARAWWQLVKGEISQAEYRDTVLFTALSDEERKVLEECIPRYIAQAIACGSQK